MPIRQEQLIEQMEEARAIHSYARRLRDGISTYLQMLRASHEGNELVQEIANGLAYMIHDAPMPDDRVTFDNERYYRRMARRNSKYREKQEIARRISGVPSREEALAMLHAKNQLREAGEEFPQTYEQFNRQAEPARRASTPINRQAPIFPSSHEDDKELDFEGGEFPTDGQNLFGKPNQPLDKPE